jgi:formiminotetrahydrofolate cyclodeaminase
MLFTGSPDEIKILYKSLDGEGRKKARAALIHKASDEGRASPEVFVNNMKRYQKQHNTFFRGKEGDELRGLLNYLDYTRQASKASTLTNTGQQMIPVAAVAGIGTDYVTTGGVGTALTAGTAALSSVYESPIVRDLMVKMSSVEKGSTAFEKLAAKLEAQLNMAATRTQGEQE